MTRIVRNACERRVTCACRCVVGYYPRDVRASGGKHAAVTAETRYTVTCPCCGRAVTVPAWPLTESVARRCPQSPADGPTRPVAPPGSEP